MKTIDELLENMAQLHSDVQDGLLDPIRAYIALNSIEKSAAEYRKSIMDDAIDKREAIGGKEHVQDGYEVTVQSRTSWSYTGDEEMDRLKALAKEREGLMKKAYTMAERGHTMADGNGVVVEPATPRVSTTLVLKRHKLYK